VETFGYRRTSASGASGAQDRPRYFEVFRVSHHRIVRPPSAGNREVGLSAALTVVIAKFRHCADAG
jgi:hypothetical protein